MTNSSTALRNTDAETYLPNHAAIREVMSRYSDGVRLGSSTAMKPVFHPNATFFGYYDGKLLAGSIQMLFDWVDANGPSRDYRDTIASVDIYGTIAVVRLELDDLKGNLAGEKGSRLSDLFQLIQVEGQWQISQKSFHWHAA